MSSLLSNIKTVVTGVGEWAIELGKVIINDSVTEGTGATGSGVIFLLFSLSCVLFGIHIFRSLSR